MSKLSPNAPCPCGSQKKYKKCCGIYHKGAFAPDALTLMKSRYSAFAANESRYIIKTTHPDNVDYTEETQKWKESIETFSRYTDFMGLKILDFTENGEEAYVTFEADLSSGILKEKSRFVKEADQWLYVEGFFD